MEAPKLPQSIDPSYPSPEATPPQPAQKGNFLGGVWGAVAGAAGAVGGTVGQTGGAVAGAVTGAAGVVAGTAASAGGVIAGTVAGAAGTAGNAAVQVGSTIAGVAGVASEVAASASGTVMGAVTGAAGTVGRAAVDAGGTVVGTVVGAAGTAGNAAVQAGGTIAGTAMGIACAVGNAAMQATDGAGYVLDLIANSPELQQLTQALKVDWLLAIVEQVDIVKAEERVKQLQQKYPHEKPGEVAHRIILEKAFYVGASGFASSLIPGLAATLFALDLAATMGLQAEMIYQIASAYGLSLQEPARKGEILALFGMTLGGNTAVKAGLGFARNIPVSGALIAASSNAALLYGLGYGACRFYEAKFQPDAAQTTLHLPQTESNQYLESILHQQLVMDQILLHLAWAGNPDKAPEQLLPELERLNLNSASLNSMIAHPQNLPALEELVDRLNQDFAVSLIAQCEKVAQMDGSITPEEASIINLIQTKLGHASH